MTYDEAITELKAEIELYDNEIVRLDAFKDTPDRKLIDALEMAIEALEKQKEKPARKPQPETGLSGKCGSCRYLDYAEKCSVGYKCTNEIMNKKRKRRIASYKTRTNKACKRYEEA